MESDVFRRGVAHGYCSRRFYNDAPQISCILGDLLGNMSSDGPDQVVLTVDSFREPEFDGVTVADCEDCPVATKGHALFCSFERKE